MNVERWEGKGHRGLELLPSPEHADDSENTQLCPAGPSGAVFESLTGKESWRSGIYNQATEVRVRCFP